MAEYQRISSNYKNNALQHEVRSTTSYNNMPFYNLPKEQRYLALVNDIMNLCIDHKLGLSDEELRKKVEEATKHILCINSFSIVQDFIKEDNTRIKYKLSPGLPNIAPELYCKRPISELTGRKESIIEFLIRVWGFYMDRKMITRADLKYLDVQAYNAIENWVSRHKSLPEKIVLPTKKAVNDSLLGHVDEENYRDLSRKASESTRTGDNSVHAKQLRRLAAAAKRRLPSSSPS